MQESVDRVGWLGYIRDMGGKEAQTHKDNKGETTMLHKTIRLSEELSQGHSQEYPYKVRELKVTLTPQGLADRLNGVQPKYTLTVYNTPIRQSIDISGLTFLEAIAQEPLTNYQVELVARRFKLGRYLTRHFLDSDSLEFTMGNSDEHFYYDFGDTGYRLYLKDTCLYLEAPNGEQVQISLEQALQAYTFSFPGGGWGLEQLAELFFNQKIALEDGESEEDYIEEDFDFDEYDEEF